MAAVVKKHLNSESYNTIALFWKGGIESFVIITLLHNIVGLKMTPIVGTSEKNNGGGNSTAN